MKPSALLGRTQVPLGGPKYPWALAQVSPRRHQLVSFGWAQDRVVLLDEILPREFRIPRLGRRRRQVEAQGIGVVAAEEVGHVHGGTAALAELPAPKIEVFMVTRVK
jgi:hypothetical protein